MVFCKSNRHDMSAALSRNVSFFQVHFDRSGTADGRASEEALTQAKQSLPHDDLRVVDPAAR